MALPAADIAGVCNKLVAAEASSLAFKSGKSSETKVPCLGLEISQPCASKSSYTAWTVFRLIPNSSASVREPGKRAA